MPGVTISTAVRTGAVNAGAAPAQTFFVVGQTARGIDSEAVLVTSLEDYENKFGGHATGHYTWYTLKTFFEEGGVQAYVARATAAAAVNASKALLAPASAAGITLTAVGAGTWGNSLSVAVTNNTTDFDITVTYSGSTIFSGTGYASLDAAVEFYLSQLVTETSEVDFSMSKRLKEIDGDHAPIEISAELREAVEQLVGRHRNAGAVSLILQVLAELRKSGNLTDERIRRLAELFPEAPARPSPLVVKKNGDLFLPDYGRTIALTPLQKTVYLFFLKRPEGIMFKDLASHRAALEELYLGLSDRTDGETLQKSVAALADPFSNSMSEKCSRIKEAFLREFTDDIASHYYIKGSRLEKKMITLDRSLVVFE